MIRIARPTVLMFLAALSVLIQTSSLHAQDTQLWYGGYLEAADGSGPIDGSVPISIRLWTDETSNESADLVCETGPSPRTPIDQGHFRTRLDSSCRTYIVENGAGGLWIEVEVDGEILGDRQSLPAAPVAVSATSLDIGVVRVENRRLIEGLVIEYTVDCPEGTAVLNWAFETSNRAVYLNSVGRPSESTVRCSALNTAPEIPADVWCIAHCGRIR
jgi:hypothetical protein